MPKLSLYGWQQPFVFEGTPAGTTDKWDDYVIKLAVGGRGAGKSQALLTAVLHYLSQNPGALILFCTPTFPKLQQDILPVLWRILEQDLELRRHKDFIYNKEEKVLEVWGSKVVFRTSEDPSVFRGPSAAAFAMDEAALSPLEAFRNLQGTLRQQGYPHHAWLSTTPAGRAHWLAKLFVPEQAVYAPGETILRPEAGNTTWMHWVGKTRDNPYGGEELYQSLISTYGEDSAIARQELNGEFVLMEGLVFDNWRMATHVVAPEKWPSFPRVLVGGIDFGFANPAALVVYGMDAQKRKYLIDEVYKSQMDEPQLIAEAKRLSEFYKIRAWAADSADPGKISALRRAGLPVYKAFKKRGSSADLSSGIGLLYRDISRMVTIKDEETGLSHESQGFYVSPLCRNFIREIENYTYMDPMPMKNPTEKPRGLDDHCLDATRYACALMARVYDPPYVRGAVSRKIA